MKLFEEGVKLTRDCQTQLTKAEAQVKKLVGFDENGKAIKEDFNTED